MNLDPHRGSDTRVKKAVIGTSIDDRFEPWTLGVVVDDLDRQDRAPDTGLLWNAPVAKREGFVRYAQRRKTLGSQLSGTLINRGSFSPCAFASSTACSKLSPRPATRDSSLDSASQLLGLASRKIWTRSSSVIITASSIVEAGVHFK